jgi:hypothetical protein
MMWPGCPGGIAISVDAMSRVKDEITILKNILPIHGQKFSMCFFHSYDSIYS